MGRIDRGIYYGSEGEPSHRGMVEADGKYYYAGKGGVLVKNRRKTVHHGMANGLVSHGSYYFDDDGVCDLDSFQSAKRKKRKSSKLKAKGAKKKLLIAFFAFSLVVIVLAAVTIIVKPENIFPKNSEPDVEEQKQISISPFQPDGEVYLCSNAMAKYYQGQCTIEEAIKTGKAYRPLGFEYSVTNAVSATLLLSENRDFTNGTAYPLDVTASSISIDNLKTDTTYYYIIEAEDAEGQRKTADGLFKTAATNRFVLFEGVYNTRDIGGYDTIYGKKVKQGVLIRGTELDGMGVINADAAYLLKNREATLSFHFASEVDLRSEVEFYKNYKSRLGDGVLHLTYTTQASYGEIFSAAGKQLMKEIFTDLSDPKNYPTYLHCTYGADRTGTVIFMLQGLLGVSAEDMVNEYHLTGLFSGGFEKSNRLNGIIGRLEEYSGETINEKIEKYFLDIGLTQSQIQSIRDIFLEQ